MFNNRTQTHIVTSVIFLAPSQMIEVVASMARGPVFLAGELMECLITFRNPMSHLSTSASR